MADVDTGSDGDSDTKNKEHGLKYNIKKKKKSKKKNMRQRNHVRDSPNPERNRVENPSRKRQRQDPGQEQDAEIDTSGHKCSLTDAITGADLSKESKLNHFFWINPSGDVFCYSFQTLVNIFKMNGSNTWKEPPTFRTEASTETMNRMENIFGRNLLNIQKYQNQRERERTLDVNFDLNEFQQREWQDRYDSYIRDAYFLVPNIDVYVCPICYAFSQQAFVTSSNSEPNQDLDNIDLNDMEHVEEEDKEVEIEAEVNDVQETDEYPDPLKVLCPSLNSMEYEDKFEDCVLGASKMCFRYKNDLLGHLGKAHDIIDTRIRGRLFKEFFDSYKLKEQDGLIQRYWIHHHSKDDTVKRYWAGDMDRAHFYGSLVSRICLIMGLYHQEESQKHPKYQQQTQEEYQDASKKQWEELTANIIADDDGHESDIDFIADDDQEVKVYKRRYKILSSDSDASSDESLAATREMEKYYKRKEKYMREDDIIKVQSTSESESNGFDSGSDSSSDSDVGAMESYRRDLAKKEKKRKKEHSSDNDNDVIRCVKKTRRVINDSSGSDSDPVVISERKKVSRAVPAESDQQWGISTRAMRRQDKLTEDGSRYSRGGLIEITAPKVEKHETLYEFGDDGEKEFEVTANNERSNIEYEKEKEFGEEKEFGNEHESKKEAGKKETQSKQTSRRQVIDDSSSSEDEIVVRQRKLNANDIDVPTIGITAAVGDSSESDSDE